MLERLHKILAGAGYGSRRQCEKFISEGRVRVDDKIITERGTKIDPSKNKIYFNNQLIKPGKKVYYLLNKPKGYVCTNDDPEGRRRVIDLLPDKNLRLYTVGRIDLDSSGLILVTNDGELCNLLTHPRYQVPKTYWVMIKGALSPQALTRLQKGVWLSEGKTNPVRLRIIKKTYQDTTLELTLREGKNREVRRILAQVGCPVKELKRISIGPLKLGPLKPGQYRPLNQREIQNLLKITHHNQDNSYRPAGKPTVSRQILRTYPNSSVPPLAGQKY
ncbi:MAG: pseudouridine synthase [Planctomycetota bacterium]